MVPKLQASHAPPCKFWTAFQVISGIRHVAPVIHGPKGCTYSVASNYKMRGCEYRGVPLEPTACTAQNEADVVYGGEGKLLEAVLEADARYHPDLIVILSCCCSGVRCPACASVAPRALVRHHLHHAWQSMGESVCRELLRHLKEGVSGPLSLRQHPSGPGTAGDLAPGIQSLPTTQLTELRYARGVCRRISS